MSLGVNVNVYWSYTNGGAAIATYVDHGNVVNGANSSGTVIYVRHDGASQITNAALYLRQFSGTYTGGATAAADFSEIISWGDAVAAPNWGGILINWNATGVFPDANWPTFALPAPANGSVHKTGVGDSELNAIAIKAASGATSDGVLQAGSSPNVRFKIRVNVPSAEGTVGIRMFDQVMTYTYTS